MTGAAIFLAAILAFFCVLYIAISKVVEEAERKLGRDLTLIEAILVGVSMPYSGAYVLLVMPDGNGGDRNE